MAIVNGYSNFVLKIPDFINRPQVDYSAGAKVWLTSFTFNADVSPLFPYINGLLEEAVFYEKPFHIRFFFEGCRCFLYPETVSAWFFEDRPQALEFADRLLVFLNDLEANKDSIEPNHDKLRPLPVADILRILPKNNCQDCGFQTCMVFAVAVGKGQVSIDRCPWVEKPLQEKAIYPVLNRFGEMVSTVTLDIDTAKMKYELEKQLEYIKSLENSLNRIEGNQTDYVPQIEKPGNIYGLTEREIQVLKLMAEGYTNVEISNVLYISPHTVKSHVIHVFNKLGVNDRTQAAVLGTRSRII